MLPAEDREERTTVTIRLFAGIRNPRWPLSAQDARTFQNRLAELPDGRGVIEPFEAYAGYDGFEVERDGLPPVIVFDGTTYEPELGIVRVDRDRQLEQFLYDTMPPEIYAKLQQPSFQFLAQRLDEKFTIDGIDGAGEVGGLLCTSAPPYPGPNGVWRTKQRDNNCYNYANDEPAKFGMSALPGGQDVSSYTVASLKAAAMSDHLVFMGTVLPAACPATPDTHYLAICLRRQFGQYRDFHCLRMDASGAWSHKDGSRRVRKTDDASQAIADLRTAHWKLQMELVGFFLSNDSTRTIRAPEDP